MRVAVIYNKKAIDPSAVIDVRGVPTKEHYNPKTVELVAKALEEGGHTVKIVESNMHMIDELNSFMPKVMSGNVPGMVFNMAYGIQGLNRYTHAPAMLEMLGVPYVGSGPEAHSIVQDKIVTKIVLQKNKIPTPDFWVFSRPDEKHDNITFPVIVKPKMESTSMGMKVVDNMADLRSAVKEMMEEYKQDILVEQFIPGREFAVGIIGNPGSLEILPIVEFDFKGDSNAIQTLDNKKENPVGKICPAELDPEKEEEMKRLCAEAFEDLGVNDFCRVDIRMDENGKLYILELNSMASLGGTGSFVVAAKAAGYTYSTLINKILDVATIRYFGESFLNPPILDFLEINEKLGSQPLRPKIRGYIRSHTPVFDDLLKQMVNINTNVRNGENIDKIGKMIGNKLHQLGFKSKVYSQFEVGNILYFSNHGGKRNDVLLISHLDTYNGNQNYVPYTRINGKVVGSGIAESKGGIVSMIAALQALRFAKRLDSIKCGILLTTDDSLGGKYSRKIVEDLAKRSGYVIGLKSGTKEGGIVTSCSGTTKYAIEMSHVDSNEMRVIDVIPDMCKKIISWRGLSENEKDMRVTVSSFKGKINYGHGTDFSTVLLEARYKNTEDGTQLDDKIKEIARKRGKVKLSVQVSKGIKRPPMVESEEIKKFYEKVEDIADRLEIKVKSFHRYMSSDLCYVPSGVPKLDGMGPTGGNLRSQNEYIIKDSVIDRGSLLALTMNNCSKK